MGPVTTLKHLGTFEDVINNEEAIMTFTGGVQMCEACIAFCPRITPKDVGVTTLVNTQQNQWLER